MAANLGLTRGLLFADAAAARLAPRLGRAAAHELVEDAADEVRRTGVGLEQVLRAGPSAGPELDAAFDLSPAVAAAAPWVDRALAHAAAVRAGLRDGAGAAAA